jgi:hypothetical protein
VATLRRRPRETRGSDASGLAAYRPSCDRATQRARGSPPESTRRSATPDSSVRRSIPSWLGAKWALPHYRAGDRLLETRRPGGAGLWRCLGRILQRLDAYGRIAPPSSERAVCTRRCGAQTGGDRCRPSRASRPPEVDRVARRVLDAHGLGEAFGHGTGQWSRTDVHEEPRVTRPRADVAPVTLEPGNGLYDRTGRVPPGWGGVRIEDDVLSPPMDARSSHRWPYPLIPRLMTVDEIKEILELDARARACRFELQRERRDATPAQTFPQSVAVRCGRACGRVPRTAEQPPAAAPAQAGGEARVLEPASEDGDWRS